MECEFCLGELPREEPENVALLQHVQASQTCQEQYGYLLDNLRSSWTASMSGG